MQKVLTQTGRTVSNGQKDYTFLSYVPVSLQDYCFEAGAEQAPEETEHPVIDLSGSLGKELSETQQVIRTYTERFRTLSEAEQQERTETVLREEADASMHLAMKPRDFRPTGIVDFQAMMALNDLDEEEKEDLSFLIRAYRYALQRSEELPISRRLLSEIHDLAMHAVHNEANKPGVFRRTVTWIGPAGSTPVNAVFVPPVPETMNAEWNRLEQFIHSEDGPDPLIRSALIHSQFEILHPFLDGNGRAGRILSMLHLYEAGVPVLALSKQIFKYKELYYRRLMKAELDGDIEGWISFWLHMIHDAAEQSL